MISCGFQQQKVNTALPAQFKNVFENVHAFPSGCVGFQGGSRQILGLVKLNNMGVFFCFLNFTRFLLGQECISIFEA